MTNRPATTSRKRPGRKRRLAGWLLVVIGVLITGVWAASAKWVVGYESSAWRVSTGGGEVTIFEHSASGYFASVRWTVGKLSANGGWLWLVDRSLFAGEPTATVHSPWVLQWGELRLPGGATCDFS